MPWKHVTKKEFEEHLQKYDLKKVLVQPFEGGLLYGYKPNVHVWDIIGKTSEAFYYKTLKPTTNYYIWVEEENE